MYQVIDKRDDSVVFESQKCRDVECYILVGDTENIRSGRGVRYTWRKLEIVEDKER